MVLGMEYSKSNHAYKKGVADPVFANTGNVAKMTYKNSKGEMLTVMVNTKNEAATVRVPLDFIGKEVTDLMTGETIVPTMEMAMEPYQYYILRK